MTLVQLWRQIRYVSRRRAMQLVRWKEDVYEEEERGCGILVVYIVVFVCFSLRFFFFVCLFHSLATTYKNGRLREFVYERGCRREDLSRVSRQSRRFSLLSLISVLSMFSSLFFLLFLSLLDRIMTDQNLSFITNDNVTQERETRGRNSSRKSFSIRSVYKS